MGYQIRYFTEAQTGEMYCVFYSWKSLPSNEGWFLSISEEPTTSEDVSSCILFTCVALIIFFFKIILSFVWPRGQIHNAFLQERKLDQCDIIQAASIEQG